MAKSKFRILGSNDQLVVAISLTIFLIFSIFFFWNRSVVNNGLIDFDDMPSHPVAYQVDVNHAPWQEFANLPGIGEKLAVEIVDLRSSIGKFETLEQLQLVNGIGAKKLEAMRPYLSLEEESAGVASQ